MKKGILFIELLPVKYARVKIPPDASGRMTIGNILCEILIPNQSGKGDNKNDMNKIITYIFLIIITTVISCKTRDTNPKVDMTSTYKTLDEINTGKVYGLRCGLIGTEPELRVKCELFISEMNIDSIQNWFNDSLNITKQVYATEGFIRLFNLDSIHLSKAQINKIKDIKMSQQPILSCSGCVYGYKTVQELLFRFTLKKEN